MKGAFVLSLLICIVNSLEHSLLGPRGPRPVNQATSRSSCSQEKKWAICTDEDMGTKCPSGCRTQGLIDVQNHQNDDRVQGIRERLESYSKSFRNTHTTVTEAVNRMRQSLEGDGRFGDTYYQQVDHLNTRLIILQNRINEQIHRINLLRDSILKQYKDITRLEVDIDIKIRACKGSCKKSFVYHIDGEHNARLEKHFQSLTSLTIERIQYRKPSHTFKVTELSTSGTRRHFKSGLDEETYPSFWDEVKPKEYALERLTEGASGSGSLYHSDTDSVAPHSNGKIATDASGERGISRGDSVSLNGRHHSVGEWVPFLSKNGSSLTTHTSHGSVTTITTISNDGKATKTVTPGAVDDFPFQSEHFSGIKGEVKGSGSSSLYNPDFDRLQISGTSKTGSKTVHSRTITVTGNLDDNSDRDDFSDFSNFEDNPATDGISGSTKTFTVFHTTKSHHWSSSDNAKGFTDPQVADEPSVQADETSDDEQPIASK
ncbi:uncharacterized protein LOC144597802 [Rhinoraja longicauda]